MAVVVVWVVEAGEAAKIGSHLVGCDGTFPIVGDGSTVVIQGQQSQLPVIIERGCHISLGKDAGLFQVTVCEVSCQVVKGDDAFLDIGREGGMPESGRVSRGKEDAPHAQLGSVH